MPAGFQESPARGLALAIGLVFLIAVPARAVARLTYYSDYFSFVGRDDQGHVAFALDTNRGQDGVEFQAEHFVALHDEKSGWHALQGNGPYPNAKRALEAIPDSEHFRFDGTPSAGMVVRSPENGLTLRVHPIRMLIQEEQGNHRLRMGSAPGVLEKTSTPYTC
jgi:hypothetical protein